jgi:cysteine desulfurase/selenocysteine lyase
MERASSLVSTTPPAAASTASFDVDAVRADFPVLRRRIYDKPLVYLDTAASAQKPQVVIDAVTQFYAQDYSSVHRGLHYLSEQATTAFEEARRTVAAFINARSKREIVFVRGTTEAINLVAQTFGRNALSAGDEVLLSAMEHHSNIVPWQMVCTERGARLRVIPINDAGEIDLDAYARLLGPRTKMVAVVHVSNALGTINPIRQIVRLAHERGVPVLVDGAQAAPHTAIDVQDLGCDFYAFSGHKVYGPTGIGALYGKAELLERMPPYEGGGSMITSVTFEKTTYMDIPARFEAGTPHIAGALGLAAALAYVKRIGLGEIAGHEHALLAYGTRELERIPGLRLIGTAAEKAGVLSFVVDGIHPHDLGTILDRDGVAIRAGHHCTQPLMERFRVPATARASLGMYNTRGDIDALVAGIRTALEVFA